MDQVNDLRQRKRDAQIESEAFLYKVVDGDVVIGKVKDWKAFFEGIPEDEASYSGIYCPLIPADGDILFACSQRTLCFHDPTSLPNLPGWPLRNVLYYLAHYQSVKRLRVICLRGGPTGATILDDIHLPESSVATSSSASNRPTAVGWEKNIKGSLTSRTVDLGSSMDPAR